MKKILLIALVIISLLLSLVGCNGNKNVENPDDTPSSDVEGNTDGIQTSFGEIESDSDNIIQNETKDEIEYTLKEKAQVEYFQEGNVLAVYQFDLFGLPADIEYTFDSDGNVDFMKADYVFVSSAMPAYDDNTTQEEYVPYEFTDADKDEMRKHFDTIKTNLQNHLGVELEQYDLLPTGMSAEYSDSEDDFFDFNVIREYSVREADGTFWRIQFSASNGLAFVNITKNCNTEETKDFWPIIDLTKI